jgi:broad specificity phosphatase PhoE
MHLYLIRHADPDYDRDTLTPQGFREAEALATRLDAHGLTHLYSSTAPRALLTAQAFTRLRPMEIARHAWLLEPAGLTIEQGGRSYSLWDTYGETIRDGGRPLTLETWDQRAPFSTDKVREMWKDFRNRADGLLAMHGYARSGGRYRIERANRERVAVFAHNGTILLFLAHLLELPLSLVYCGFYAWPSSVTTIFFEEHSETWAVPRALQVADLSHLAAAGLSPQPRAMGANRYEPYL